MRDIDTQNIIISSLKPYHPEMIGLFGSYARGENITNSDIDVLVRFQDSLSLLQLVHLENVLTQVSEQISKNPQTVKNQLQTREKSVAYLS